MIRLARQKQLKLGSRLQHSLQEHRDILAAIEARDGATASTAMSQHIHNQYIALKEKLKESVTDEVD